MSRASAAAAATPRVRDGARPHHALPPWLTARALDGKPAGVLFKVGIALSEPSPLPRTAYPQGLVDDLSRPRIFDAHVLRAAGQALWPAAALATRVEVHLEHGAVRFYRACDAARFRVAKLRQHAEAVTRGGAAAAAAAGAGSVEISKVTGVPVMMSIHDDVRCFVSVSEGEAFFLIAILLTLKTAQKSFQS